MLHGMNVSKVNDGILLLPLKELQDLDNLVR